MFVQISPQSQHIARNNGAEVGIDLCSQITKLARCDPTKNPQVHVALANPQLACVLTVLSTSSMWTFLEALTIFTAPDIDCQSQLWVKNYEDFLAMLRRNCAPVLPTVVRFFPKQFQGSCCNQLTVVTTRSNQLRWAAIGWAVSCAIAAHSLGRL